MTEPLVLSDNAGPVRVLAMNRPESRNALNSSLIEALYAALCDVDADPSVRAVSTAAARWPRRQAAATGPSYPDRLVEVGEHSSGEQSTHPRATDDRPLTRAGWLPAPR
jgi:1,4-dihydroxy-2-naphthoyl-CoA synthase